MKHIGRLMAGFYLLGLVLSLSGCRIFIHDRYDHERHDGDWHHEEHHEEHHDEHHDDHH